MLASWNCALLCVRLVLIRTQAGLLIHWRIMLDGVSFTLVYAAATLLGSDMLQVLQY